MDPNTGEPGEFGDPGDGGRLRPLPLPGDGVDTRAGEAGGRTDDEGAPQPRDRRPVRDVLAAPDPAPAAPALIAEVVAGDCLLVVNPVDGGEVSPCPPGRLPVPVRRSAEGRALRMAAARPAPPAGPTGPQLPLLERDEERERIVRLLSRGRSVRLTGPSGVGRSALLEAVAGACAGLAPEGVIRLSGYHRGPGDLLQALYEIVFNTEGPVDGYRPGRPQLLDLLAEVGAVVVVDDLEFGGAQLEELLSAAPECAFLLTATPEVPAPASDSSIEEIFLPGLTRAACRELLEHAVERPLLEDEIAWAADLWFESEGLPLRFVQAGALLRQLDRLGVEALEGDRPVWGGAALPADAAPDAAGTEDAAPEDAVPGTGADIALPSLAESAAPAPLLASRMSEAARETLRFAVALGGEIPHQAHLPALVGDTHGDAAIGELVACGLAVPVAAHYRLAAGVRQQLSGSALTDGAADQAHRAAQHYAWWAGHRSVTADRVAVESEAILAALTACRDEGHTATAVLLARTAAPVFAAALHWNAWERALRTGQEAARQAGEVAEEAYFHHELGVLALCTGNLDRARTELEASIGLRGALADRQGTTVGRRALALVADRSGVTTPMVTPFGIVAPSAPSPAFEPAAPTTLLAKVPDPGAATTAVPQAGAHRRQESGGSRRNLAAAGAGALLAVVLGTVVTLGATANHDGDGRTPLNVQPVESSQPDPGVVGPPTEAPDTLFPTQSVSATPVADETSASPVSAGPTQSPTPGSATPTPTPARPTPPPTPTPSYPTPTWSHPHSPTPTASPSGSASPTGSGTASPSTSNTASQSTTGSPVTATGTSAPAAASASGVM